MTEYQRIDIVSRLFGELGCNNLVILLVIQNWEKILEQLKRRWYYLTLRHPWLDLGGLLRRAEEWMESKVWKTSTRLTRQEVHSIFPLGHASVKTTHGVDVLTRQKDITHRIEFDSSNWALAYSEETADPRVSLFYSTIQMDQICSALRQIIPDIDEYRLSTVYHSRYHCGAFEDLEDHRIVPAKEFILEPEILEEVLWLSDRIGDPNTQVGGSRVVVIEGPPSSGRQIIASILFRKVASHRIVSHITADHNWMTSQPESCLLEFSIIDCKENGRGPSSPSSCPVSQIVAKRGWTIYITEDLPNLVSCLGNIYTYHFQTRKTSRYQLEEMIRRHEFAVHPDILSRFEEDTYPFQAVFRELLGGKGMDPDVFYRNLGHGDRVLR